jgi:hypothetical protein
VAEHFDEMFDMNIRNVSYRETPVPAQLLDYEFHYINDTHMNMTVTFFEPYMLGLLVKKSDRLYIRLKYDLLTPEGKFEEKYKHLNGMFLKDPDRPNLINTLHKEDCKKDAVEKTKEKKEGEAEDASGRRLAEKTETQDTHKNRKMIFGYARIDLQFDWRNELMAYWR